MMSTTSSWTTNRFDRTSRMNGDAAGGTPSERTAHTTDTGNNVNFIGIIFEIQIRIPNLVRPRYLFVHNGNLIDQKI